MHTPEYSPPQRFMTFASICMIGLMLVYFLNGRGDYNLLRKAGAMVLLFSGPFMIMPLFKVRAGGMTTIIDTGIYSLVRHPQYMGYMGFTVGFSLMAQHWAGYGLALCAVVFFVMQVLSEERQLNQYFPLDYSAYCSRVPRFNLAAGVMRRMRRR